MQKANPVFKLYNIKIPQRFGIARDFFAFGQPTAPDADIISTQRATSALYLNLNLASRKADQLAQVNWRQTPPLPLRIFI
jgi:hypothetical protein